MQVELFIEGNAALADAIEKGRIDLAIVIGHEDRATAQTVGQIDLVWIASSAFAPPQEQPLPLAVLGPQCAFRKCAIQHLEATAIAYRIAANSPSLDGLWAALLGGLGVTARTALNVPEGLMSAARCTACFSRTSAHHSASQFALRRCSRRSHGRAPLPVFSVDAVFSVQRKCSP
jgi:DNA-binding transcriptional LysR family regulator